MPTPKPARNQPNEGTRGTPATTQFPNPCQYVSAAEAASILRAPSVHEIEAPLGPTCILQAQGQKISPTIAVEVLAVTRQVHKMKHASKTMLGRRAAYCGRIGASIMLVPLNRYETLDVSAPCTVATELARVALSRIKG